MINIDISGKIIIIALLIYIIGKLINNVFLNNIIEKADSVIAVIKRK